MHFLLRQVHQRSHLERDSGEAELASQFVTKRISHEKLSGISKIMPQLSIIFSLPYPHSPFY